MALLLLLTLAALWAVSRAGDPCRGGHVWRRRQRGASRWLECRGCGTPAGRRPLRAARAARAALLELDRGIRTVTDTTAGSCRQRATERTMHKDTSNHPHAVLYDAARQLQQAARAVELAATDFAAGDTAGEAEGRRRLRLAQANITAALARLDSYPTE